MRENDFTNAKPEERSAQKLMDHRRVTLIPDIEHLPFNGHTDTLAATSDTLLWQSIEAVKPSQVNTRPTQIWFPVLTTAVITSQGMLRPSQT